MLVTDSNGRNAAPNLYRTDWPNFLQDQTLGEEVFGPPGLVVRVGSPEDMEALAKNLEGQLTCTLHMDDGDT